MNTFSLQSTLFWVHGFLGMPSDWDQFSKDFPNSIQVDLRKLGLFDLNSIAHWINGIAVKSSILSRMIVGYSMGGRIALHCLVREPTLWKAAVIISAHPGLLDELEKKERLISDQKWSEHFQNMPWEILLKHWNSQKVFGGIESSQVRREEDFSREFLSKVLVESSLGQQKDLRSSLKNLEVPILWISGERDMKFKALAEESASLNSRFHFHTIRGAGHRVPWDQPDQFQSALIEFFRKVTIE